ncbi:MAG TPA: dockerin type I domain-containing protein [Chitinophagaceae bacterium]
MKCCIAFLLPLVLIGTAARAQLVNDGTTLKIQPGTVLLLTGNVENKNTGTMSNDGRLEVRGNFLNTATYTTTTADDSLIMSGSGSVTLNPGSSTISVLYINKTTNSDHVTLAGSTTINSKLTYNSGTLSTNPLLSSLTLNAAITVPFEFTAGREIIGRVRRTGWANSTEVIFNQPNMLITTNAGTAPTEFTVNMIPEIEGGDPSLAERKVKRKFVFSQAGGTGFTTDVRFPYTSSELNTNAEASLVPWNLPATIWTGRLTPVTRDAVSDWVSISGIAEADIAKEWKLADSRYRMNATALLRGPWNSSTLLMNTSLNNAGAGPLGTQLVQPYNTTPFNYPGAEFVPAGFFATHTNIVDWILVEFRKPADPLDPATATSATTIGRKAGFLLNNGSIVDVDGVTPIEFDLNKQGDGFMVIRHRNHLDVMSNLLTLDVLGNYSNDFRLLSNLYKKVGASSESATSLLNTSFVGMWAGDANKSRTINSGDVTAIQNAIAIGTTGYKFTDVNLSGTINSGDITVTQNTIAVGGSVSPSARNTTDSSTKKSNVPDPINE